MKLTLNRREEQEKKLFRTVINRLQRMRGRACFRVEERLAGRPRTPDPCVVRPLSKLRG